MIMKKIKGQKGCGSKKNADGLFHYTELKGLELSFYIILTFKMAFVIIKDKRIVEVFKSRGN